jgi:hypothetical protein
LPESLGNFVPGTHYVSGNQASCSSR